MKDFLEDTFKWLHIYIVHFGALTSFMFVLNVYVKGLPNIKELPNLFKSSIVSSAIIALFSSHSHMHYLSHLANK